MKTRFTISIKKKPQSYWLILLILLMPFFMVFFSEILGLPYAVRYILDPAWMLLFVLLLQNKGRRRKAGLNLLVLWISLFAAYTMLMYLLNYQSVLYYLWGFRNSFRFYIVFFAAAALMRPEDGKKHLRLMDTLFWVNAVISAYQYGILDLHGDHLGGFFGTVSGANGYTNLFFLIIITKSIVCYLHRQESLQACLAKCGTALVIAAMAEMKFFFVEFIAVIVMAILFTNFTWRKLWVILGGFAGVLACAALLTRLFPGFAGWFSLHWFLEVATARRGYTSTGDLNRLTAIGQINELWLHGWPERLFGMGLGNTDTSSFSFLNTPFYQANQRMHHSWIHYGMLYLETGYIGLVFFWGFFVMLFFRIRKIESFCVGLDRSICCMDRILVALCPIISVYNASLRTESGYLIYIVLAIPFCLYRTRSNRSSVSAD